MRLSDITREKRKWTGETRFYQGERKGWPMGEENNNRWL
jgi:hypothetical protein